MSIIGGIPRSQQDKIAAWTACRPLDGHSPTDYRVDAYGHIIRWADYGTQGDHGWEIDHEIPSALGGSDHSTNLKQRRNTAFHGVWGWHLEKRSKTRQPAAFHHKTKDNPVRSQDLRPMAREMIECSKVAGRITCALLGFDYVPAVQFTWGAGDKEPPEWLAKDYTQIAKGRRPQDRRTQ